MSKIVLTLLIVVIILAGVAGLFWWQNKEQPSGLPLAENELLPEEISGWNKYENLEWGIAFYYPPEWGEVIDLVWADNEGESEDYLRFIKEMEQAGTYLCFSKMDTWPCEWGPHIRLTSVQEIKSRMLKFLSLSNKDKEGWQGGIGLYPLLGTGVATAILTYSPEIASNFEGIIEEMANMTDNKKSEELKENIFSIFMLFSEGLRDIMKLESFTNIQKSLQGALAIGGEGWDIGSRGFYEVFLTPFKTNKNIIFVSLSFSGEEDLYKKEVFEKFVKNIRLIGDNVQIRKTLLSEENLLP